MGTIRHSETNQTRSQLSQFRYWYRFESSPILRERQKIVAVVVERRLAGESAAKVAAEVEVPVHGLRAMVEPHVDGRHDGNAPRVDPWAAVAACRGQGARVAVMQHWIQSGVVVSRVILKCTKF